MRSILWGSRGRRYVREPAKARRLSEPRSVAGAISTWRRPFQSSSNLHFAGRRVATFSRRRAPDLYEQLYAGLAAAGACLFEVPELRRSILSDRPDLIVSTIVTSAANTPLMYGLVRLHGAVLSIAADRFWKWVAEAYPAD